MTIESILKNLFIFIFIFALCMFIIIALISGIIGEWYIKYDNITWITFSILSGVISGFLLLTNKSDTV